MNAVTIDFEQPLKLRPQSEDSWDLSGANFAGVYLWTIQSNDGFRVFYIGQAQNVAYRTRQHLKSYLCGQYQLHDPQKLADGYLDYTFKSIGTAYEKTLLQLDVQRELLNAMLDKVYIFAARVEGEKSARCTIETALIDHFKKSEFTKSTIENPKVSLRTLKMDVQYVVVAKENIVGLPDKLTV